jgi:hypothetical protein
MKLEVGVQCPFCKKFTSCPFKHEMAEWSRHGMRYTCKQFVKMEYETITI